MNATIFLTRAIVRPYYRQNTSLFLFLIVLMFSFSSLVSHDPLQYHYKLIVGMLTVTMVLVLVFGAWFLYMAQCARFVGFLLKDPRYTFLNLLHPAGNLRSWLLFLYVQLWLSLPISSYAIAITGVAVYQGWYGMAILVPAYIFSLCMLGALWCQLHLHHPGRTRSAKAFRLRLNPYWVFFIRYILDDRKSLFFAIKLFSCSTLVLLLKDLGPDDYDLRMPILFYSFGVFAHGVLIYRFRELENTRLVFYRGLPVSLWRRFLQYVLLYGVLFIPETITFIRLMNRPLHTGDAILLAVYGYSLLLLLNSFLFAGALKMGEYVRLIFAIFLLQYGFVLAGAMVWLTGIFLLAATGMFFWGYYRSFVLMIPRSETLG
jgi:hypothetical protein